MGRPVSATTRTCKTCGDRVEIGIICFDCGYHGNGYSHFMGGVEDPPKLSAAWSKGEAVEWEQ